MFDREDDRVLKEWLRGLLGRGDRGDFETKLKPYLRDSVSSVILRLILENPGIGPEALARWTGADLSVVEGYLSGLASDGIVAIEKEGPGAGCRISGAAKAAVVKYLPLNYQCPGLMRE